MATHEDVPFDDIEKQSPIPPTHSSPCQTTIYHPTTQNPNAISTVDDHTNDTKAKDSLVIHIIMIILLLLVFPLFLGYVIGSICINGSVESPNACFSGKGSHKDKSSKPKKKGIYKQDVESIKDIIRRLNIVVSTRAGCLALSWLVVNLCVPSLTSTTLFGYTLWKCTLLAIVILLGFTSINLATVILLVAISFFNERFTKQPNLDYFLRGLQDSIASLLHFTSILLLWLLYFRTDRGLHPSERFDKFATWTFVSVLVGSILWVVKSAALLEWKANAVYKRFKVRILTAGFQLYFLSIIMEGWHYPELLPWRNCEKKQDEANLTPCEKKQDEAKLTPCERKRDEPNETPCEKKQDEPNETPCKKKQDEPNETPCEKKQDEPNETPTHTYGKTTEVINNNNNDNHTAKDRKNLRSQDSMLSESVAKQHIDDVAKIVTCLTRGLRENDGIPKIIAKCQAKIRTHNNSTTIQYITVEALERIFGLRKEDAELLFQELKGEEISEKIAYDAFEKWIVDAHKNCLSVGYTLVDAFAVVSVLNRVIISFIFVTVILLWLLITGLATTTVLVMIASPFLALSFVFGDTCKTFFQGIIFSFVTHPFDVGDRCIIDGIELEVKRIGILTTKFVKIGTKEKVLYPNTSLATEVITNLEGEPDPSDVIELILDSSTTKSQILLLMENLERFFKNTKPHGSYEKNIHMAVKEIGSSIKVSLSFTHVMNVQDDHSQCFVRKNKQRSELLIHVKQVLEDQQIKLATS